jgi:hypothetical protein
VSAGLRGREFTLLGRPDCHLCHEMYAVAEPLLAERGARLVQRDVRDDPETDRLYGLEIPVLLLDGREIVRHRVSAARLAGLLERL